ncbi:MAG: PilN domain-containing protein [Deltaproteobacteria bacterium]|nr:PilN domain-containing protein [Deltaproteobacteria bacterium]
MIRINLLPVRAAQKKEKLRSQLSILFLCLVLVGVGCGALYVQQKLATDDIKEKIADLNQQNKALRNKLGEVADFEKKKKELEQKLGVLNDLKAGKAGPVHLLDELGRALPSKVWLTQFSEGGGRVTLAGYGDNEETVASFMNRLERSPYYRNVELSITEQASVGGVKMQKFTLKCQTEKPSPN